MKNLLSFLLIASGLTAAAQPKKIINLPGYYDSPIHFGFSLMLNRSVLVLDQSTAAATLPVTPYHGPGFGIGIVSEYRIHRHFSIRFIPDLSFIEQNVEYRQGSTPGSPIIRQRIESTLLNLPVNVKIMTARFDNFALYMLGGGRYSRGLAKPSTNPLLKHEDIAVDAGIGVDIFMLYFKFSADLKLINGLYDLSTSNSGIFNSNSIKSQCLVLSLNFEG
jgi:hypothetical protein